MAVGSNFKFIFLFSSLILISANEFQKTSLINARGDDAVLGRQQLQFTVNMFGKKPTFLDKIGHAYEGVRYGLKGATQAIGAKIGYPIGGIVGIFSPKVTVKNGAAKGTYVGANVVSFPFHITRPLNNYAQTFVPGLSKYPFYPAKAGLTYLIK